MSRLDELLEKKCPRGVQFERLGGIVRIRNGRDFKHLDPGAVPVYGSGGIMTFVDQSFALGPTVLIPRKGSLSNLFYVEGPFWTVDTIFYTEVSSALVPKFFYYFLATQHLEDLNQAGGVPSLTQSVLNELLVPVPPVEVQREIVAILDTFTELEAKLEAELEAELEARRAQFNFYRDSMLSFRNEPEVRWATMSDVGHFKRGRRFTKADRVSEGTPSIHYGEIYTHYGVSADSAVSFVDENLRGTLRFAQPGDVVIASVGETVDDVGKAVAWLGDEDVAIHDDCFAFSHSMNPKFVSYYFQTAALHAEKNKFVARAKVKRLSGTDLGKLAIPVPGLATQERLVGILDELGLLVNDLSVGLPAELAARRQQYEHYRDRLLTFEEAPA